MFKKIFKKRNKKIERTRVINTSITIIEKVDVTCDSLNEDKNDISRRVTKWIKKQLNADDVIIFDLQDFLLDKTEE